MMAPGAFGTLVPKSIDHITRGACLCVTLGVAAVALAACSANPTTPSADAGGLKGHGATATSPLSGSAAHGRLDTSTTVNVTTTTGAVTTTTPRVTTTTASGVAQPLASAQNSNGAAKGETTAMTIGNVRTDSGDLSFTVNVRNTGSVPYDCTALKAQARTASSLTAIVAPIAGESGVLCAGGDDALAPGAKQTFAFFVPLVGGKATQVIALPFGSYASRVVWSIGHP